MKTEFRFLILVFCQLAMLLVIVITIAETNREISRIDYELNKCVNVCRNSLIPMGDYYPQLKRVEPLEVKFNKLD